MSKTLTIVIDMPDDEYMRMWDVSIKGTKEELGGIDIKETDTIRLDFATLFEKRQPIIEGIISSAMAAHYFEALEKQQPENIQP